MKKISSCCKNWFLANFDFVSNWKPTSPFFDFCNTRKKRTQKRWSHLKNNKGRSHSKKSMRGNLLKLTCQMPLNLSMGRFRKLGKQSAQYQNKRIGFPVRILNLLGGLMHFMKEIARFFWIYLHLYWDDITESFDFTGRILDLIGVLVYCSWIDLRLCFTDITESVGFQFRILGLIDNLVRFSEDYFSLFYAFFFCALATFHKLL